MIEDLIRVEAPHFVAGLVTVYGCCTEAAPILSWAIGKSEPELRAYFSRKGWKATRSPANARGLNAAVPHAESAQRLPAPQPDGKAGQ